MDDSIKPGISVSLATNTGETYQSASAGIFFVTSDGHVLLYHQEYLGLCEKGGLTSIEKQARYP